MSLVGPRTSAYLVATWTTTARFCCLLTRNISSKHPIELSVVILLKKLTSQSAFSKLVCTMTRLISAKSS